MLDTEGADSEANDIEQKFDRSDDRWYIRFRTKIQDLALHQNDNEIYSGSFLSVLTKTIRLGNLSSQMKYHNKYKLLKNTRVYKKLLDFNRQAKKEETGREVELNLQMVEENPQNWYWIASLESPSQGYRQS